MAYPLVLPGLVHNKSTGGAFPYPPLVIVLMSVRETSAAKIKGL